MQPVNFFKILSIALALLLVINLWTTLTLKKEQEDLQREVNALQSQLSNQVDFLESQLDSGISNIRQALSAESSLLDQSSLTLSYEQGKLLATAYFLPKTISPEETVQVTFASGTQTQQVPAVCPNGTYYQAAALLEPSAVVSASVAFVSPSQTRQERLPDVDAMEALSFQSSSNWVDEGMGDEEDKKGMLAIVLSPCADMENPPYAQATRIQLTVVNVDTGEEIARMDLKESTDPDLAERFGFGLDADTAYLSDLTPYYKQLGNYEVFLELETQGTLTYRESVAGFENLTTARSGKRSGHTLFYPVFPELSQS